MSDKPHTDEIADLDMTLDLARAVMGNIERFNQLAFAAQKLLDVSKGLLVTLKNIRAPNLNGMHQRMVSEIQAAEHLYTVAMLGSVVVMRPDPENTTPGPCEHCQDKGYIEEEDTFGNKVRRPCVACADRQTRKESQ